MSRAKLTRPAAAEMDLKVVRHMARLAHLTLDEGELSTMGRDLSRILGYVAKLDELDTTDVPATTHAVALPTAWRDDLVRPGLAHEQRLGNAPEPLGEGFGVPKIIE